VRLQQHVALFSTEEPAFPYLRKLVNRQRLREFLRAVPRTEPETWLELLGPEPGTPPRFVARQTLTEAIEQMHPRMRQIIRLTLEKRNTRPQVQAYLNDISPRTLERDQAAGLDLLICLAQEPEEGTP
jgi:hypothetical protein